MDYYKYLREKKDSTIKSDKIVRNKNVRKECSNICYKCNSISLSSVDGFISCTNCGAINNDIIHYNEDTRFYGINDSKMTADPSRLGLPINPFTPKSSLGTIILGYGNNSFRTLHKWYSTNYKERSLLKAFDVMLNHMKYNNIILPTNVLDKAKLFYKITSTHTIKRGSSRKAMMAISIYYACIVNKIEISKLKLSKIFDIKKSKITNGLKDFYDVIFNTNKAYLNQININSFETLFFNISKLLEIDNKYIIIALVIAKFSDQVGILSDNTPQSITTGCTYFVLNYYNYNITKKIISNKCNISEVTISKIYVKLKSNFDLFKPILNNVQKYIDMSDNKI